MLGRRKSTFKAELCGWCVTGASSKDEALTILESVLTRQCEFIETRRYLRGKTTTWVLHYANGWQYDIVHDENTNAHGSCMLSCKTYMEALEQFTTRFKQHEDCQ